MTRQGLHSSTRPTLAGCSREHYSQQLTVPLSCATDPNRRRPWRSCSWRQQRRCCLSMCPSSGRTSTFKASSGACSSEYRGFSMLSSCTWHGSCLTHTLAAAAAVVSIAREWSSGRCLFVCPIMCRCMQRQQFRVSCRAPCRNGFDIEAFAVGVGSPG